MNEQDETDEQPTNDGSVAAVGESDDETAPEDPPRLASTLVRYDGQPDQVTVYPPDMSSVERMSTWITIDADDCLEPTEMR